MASPKVSPLHRICAVTVSLVQLKLSRIVVSPSVVSQGVTTYFQLEELWYVVEQGIKQDRDYEVDSGVLRSDRNIINLQLHQLSWF